MLKDTQISLQPQLFDSPTSGALSDHHYEMLSKGSGIADEIIFSRGYRTITDIRELAGMGFSSEQINGLVMASEGEFGALVIPVWSVDGRVAFHRIRQDKPRKDDGRKRYVKYEQPAGTGTAVDVPPLARSYLKNVVTRLWVTEGERKADSIISRGEAAVALLGVGCWQSDGIPKPEWEQVRLIGREVVVAFDGDAESNLQVRKQLDRLCCYLSTRGAHVSFVRFPNG
jgi:putative DNA primase/helicase